MTRGAFPGSGLVEQYLPGRNRPDQLVAGLATNILVDALERERRPCVVVEQRRFPFRAVVAFPARRGLPLGELPAVDIFVTVLALGRSRSEVHVHELGLHVWRLMAIDASGRAVRSYQGERSLGVIES